MKLKFLITNLLVVFFLNACTKTAKETKVDNNNTIKSTVKYAKRFDVQEFDTYKKLIVTSPFPNSNAVFEYYLVTEKTNLSLLDHKAKIIHIPIKTIVVTSTTNISMLEQLEVQNSLVGFPHTDFISSKKVRSLVDSGHILDLGVDANLNTEMVIDINPNVVVAYGMKPGNKSLVTVDQSGIPVIYNGAWLEETPLGRAEWIKVFGHLFGKSKKANNIFQQITTDYNEAKKLAIQAQNKPKVLSGALFKDVWSLPAGESYVAHFLADANTDYLWKNTSGTGSLQLNFENVFVKAHEADLWISPGYFETKADMYSASKMYEQFDAFNQNHIYTFSALKGATGGVIYYEQGPTRPDLVLKDIIKIAHPELLPNYELTFYSKME